MFGLVLFIVKVVRFAEKVEFAVQLGNIGWGGRKLNGPGNHSATGGGLLTDSGSLSDVGLLVKVPRTL